jgi:acetyl esterase/lipase
MKSIVHLSVMVLLSTMFRESAAQDTFDLWEGEDIPFSKASDLKEYEEEAWGVMCAYDVTEPTLTVYPAQGNNSGKAVILIPGGGYSLVAIYHEGHDLANVLAAQGITAAVLKYRLPNPKSSDQPEMVPLTDGRRAVALMRTKADAYGFDPAQLGVMGFSAGSHLATVLSLWNDVDADEKPNFSVLVYGVTNLSAENLKWLEDDLYYRALTDEEKSQNTLLDLVTKNTPPAFLVHAYDDDVCHVDESLLYAAKLREHDVSTEMHLFPKGGHGFGMGRKEDGTDQWVSLFINWLKAGF